MKMKSISLVMAAIMVSLGVLGVVNSKSIATAAPKALQVFITNWPSLFQVREQNLDTNGNIKIHEQGTANVNITNTAPISVTNQSVPTTWEYFRMESPSLQEINDLGAEGWELASTAGHAGGGVLYVFKRPL